MAIRDLMGIFKNKSSESGEDRPNVMPADSNFDKSMAALFIVLLAFLQFPPLYYNPAAQIPSKADREAGAQIVETIRGIDGDVFVPSHGYLAELAGKKMYAHECAIGDVWRGTDTDISMEMLKSITRAIEDRHFQAVIVDSMKNIYINAINNACNYSGPMLNDQTSFWPITGLQTRPEDLFTLKPQ